MEIRRHRAGVVRRGIACVVGALVVLAVGTGAAHASTESVADPAHDNGLGFDPRGDIVQISVTNDPFEVDLMLQSATFEDPSTSADWLGGGATIVFGVDVDGDQQADFLVTYSNNGFGPYVLVASQSTNSLVCGGTPLWDASASTYTAVIDASCFANASGMAVNASFDYYDENWTESFDGTSYTAPASLPTTTTTSTTTTTTTTVAPTTTTTTVPPTTTTSSTTTTTVVDTTTTTVSTTTTTVPGDCKPGNGWGDDNHVHCGSSSPSPLTKHR